ncbi:hypothetical protein FJY94_08960, partial [Candidatus Kaiserbacteria bacterium]|nr:hypothetical protein [Candidatus Kaiserbacteria bacterium]
MKMQITKSDIELAIAPSIWDVGNAVLYSLCQQHAKHDEPSAVVAKLWLIGRAYAAAIERRKNAQHTSDGSRRARPRGPTPVPTVRVERCRKAPVGWRYGRSADQEAFQEE